MGGFFVSFLYFFVSFGLVIISIVIVRKKFNFLKKYQFSDIDDVMEKEELMVKASENIPYVNLNFSYNLNYIISQYLNIELIFNIIQVLFGFLSNNWISFLIAIIFLAYNLYSRMRKKDSFGWIIDDMKRNLNSSNKVGLEYKVKFIVYVIISIYALCFAILAHFDDDDDTLISYKIFD